MSDEPELREGASGEAVERLQSQLHEFGLDVGPIDGDFGPRTEAAVKAYQSACGLEPDGVVGPNTWLALTIGGFVDDVVDRVRGDDADHDRYHGAPPDQPVLREGSRGEWVSYLQAELAKRNLDPGPVDGHFGPRTEAAVCELQRRWGIDVDGVVGSDTWGALQSIEAIEGAIDAVVEGVDRYLSAATDPAVPYVEFDHGHLMHDLHAIAEGTHQIADAAEALRFISEAAAGGETALLAVAEVVGPIGWVAFLAFVGIELVDAFTFGEEIQERMGLCYGMVWQALEMPDVHPEFRGLGMTGAQFVREAWEEGLAQGREKGREPKFKNFICMQVAYDVYKGVASDLRDGREVLNDIWAQVWPERLENTVLPWPAPAYDGQWERDEERKYRILEERGLPLPLEDVIDLSEVTEVNYEVLDERYDVGTKIPYWMVGPHLILGSNHPQKVYDEVMKRHPRGGFVTITREPALSVQGAVSVSGCENENAFRTKWPLHIKGYFVYFE